jgi:hypothetical protein
MSFSKLTTRSLLFLASFSVAFLFFGMQVQASNINNMPVGFIDGIQINTYCNYSNIIVTGWSKDPDNNLATESIIYINGVIVDGQRVNINRPDAGGMFGFKKTVTITNAQLNQFNTNPRGNLKVFAPDNQNRQSGSYLAYSQGSTVTVASTGCPTSNNTSTSNNLQNPPLDLPSNFGNTVKWQGMTYKYNFNTSSFSLANAEDDGKPWVVRACNIEGVLSQTCGFAKNEARERELFAFRNRIMIDNNHEQVRNLLTQNGFNANSNGIAYRQVFYTYKENGVFKPWFMFDAQGNRKELSSSNNTLANYLVAPY